MTIVLIAVDRALVITSMSIGRRNILRLSIMIAITWLVGIMIGILPATEALSVVKYIHPTRHLHDTPGRKAISGFILYHHIRVYHSNNDRKLRNNCLLFLEAQC